MLDTDTIRRKVLELALQGNLTEQLILDGTAEELYNLIQEEKKVLIKERKSKIMPIANDEIPFVIPNNWKWVRLGELSESIQYGYNAPAKKSGRIKMVRISDIQDNEVLWDTVPYCDIDEASIHIYLLKKNDILFARTGGTVGKSYMVCEIPQEAIYAGYLIRTRYSKHLCAKYMKYFMESGLYWRQLLKGTTATAQPNCNGQSLSKMILPLPPISEQYRIVDRIDQIFEVLGNIDKLQSQYSDNVDILKRKLIDAAILGKLTKQLPENGTAEDLYAKIQAQKVKLMQEGKIKKEKVLPEITEGEVPFNIPSNWKWVRLGDISAKISSGNTPAGGKKSNAYVEKGYSFFREQNIYNDGIHEEGLVYITEEVLKTRENSTVMPMDILLNITGGSIGRCALVSDDFTKGSINQHILIIRMIDPRLRFYIHTCICSPFIQKYIKGNTVGDKDGFSAGRCKNMLIPLPPLEEQRRIVSVINEVLTYAVI